MFKFEFHTWKAILFWISILKRPMRWIVYYFILSVLYAYIDVFVGNQHCLRSYMNWSVLEIAVYAHYSYCHATNMVNANAIVRITIYLQFSVVGQFPERYNFDIHTCKKGSIIQNNCRAI